MQSAIAWPQELRDIGKVAVAYLLVLPVGWYRPLPDAPSVYSAASMVRSALPRWLTANFRSSPASPKVAPISGQ